MTAVSTNPNLPYRILIGLEVHVQLATQTKLFCRCSTRFGKPPNTQVCPVCLGLPGALPVLNRRAIELAARAGSALNCQLAPFTKWDRKNYFYPDLPKGYQTSQYDLPICAGGHLDIEVESDAEQGGGSWKRIRLVRAHLEEDAGKSMHDERAGRADTRIDLNRAGTPLLEIVTEPDLSNAAEAKAFLAELRLLMVYLGVSDGNMQEGSVRADANVNLLIPSGEATLATPIVEIKNLNSFRMVERAILFEVDRQYREFLRSGLVRGQAPKQTRGWNDVLGQTEMQREKEEEADYRYFPCPDLVPVVLSEHEKQRAQCEASQTPRSFRTQLIDRYGLKASDAEILVQQGLGAVEYLLATIESGASPKRACAWMLQEVLRYLNDAGSGIEHYPVAPRLFGELLQKVDTGSLETAHARQALAYLVSHPDATVSQAVDTLGIVQVDSSEIEALCDVLLNENPDVVEKVRGGNAKAIAALVGQAKKQNRHADPRMIQEICLRKIAER